MTIVLSSQRSTSTYYVPPNRHVNEIIFRVRHTCLDLQLLLLVQDLRIIQFIQS